MPTIINGTTGIDTIQDNTVSTAKLQNSAVTPVKTQVGSLPSMVRLNTANGYGSTNTKIRRFTNVVTNQGADITYADSATLGASFTINTNGVYAICYTDNGNNASSWGLSLNSSQLTTNVAGINYANQLSVVSVTAANFSGNTSWQGYLTSGDVVRPHSDGVPVGTTASLFTITRVA